MLPSLGVAFWQPNKGPLNSGSGRQLSQQHLKRARRKSVSPSSSQLLSLVQLSKQRPNHFARRALWWAIDLWIAFLPGFRNGRKRSPMPRATEMSIDNRKAIDAAYVAAVDATRQLVVEIHYATTVAQLEVTSILMKSVHAGSVCHGQAVTGIREVSSAMAKLGHDAIEAVQVFREHAATVQKARSARES